MRYLRILGAVIVVGCCVYTVVIAAGGSEHVTFPPDEPGSVQEGHGVAPVASDEVERRELLSAADTLGAKEPLSPAGLAEGMHLQPAPLELQLRYARLAEIESNRAQEKADRAIADPNGGADAYIEFLEAHRASRVRYLAHRQLLDGKGVLALDGHDDSAIASDHPVVRYMAVATYHGRKADLVIVVDDDANYPGTSIADLSEALRSAAMQLLRDKVDHFNMLPLEERKQALSAANMGTRLPSMSDTLLYLVGDKVARDMPNALLYLR